MSNEKYVVSTPYNIISTVINWKKKGTLILLHIYIYPNTLKALLGGPDGYAKRQKKDVLYI